MSEQPSVSNIVTFKRPKDAKVLTGIDYPILALEQDDRDRQEYLRKRYAPNLVSRLMHLTKKDNILLLLSLWTIIPLYTFLYTGFLALSDKVLASLVACFVVSIGIGVFNIVSRRLEIKRDAITRVLDTIKYNPYPQDHTRGYKMIQEAMNISSQVLDSWAWKNGMAVKAIDIKTECLEIINGVMGVYQNDNGIREITCPEAEIELDKYQERLDKIRHYARHEMTNPSTSPIDIIAA